MKRKCRPVTMWKQIPQRLSYIIFIHNGLKGPVTKTSLSEGLFTWNSEYTAHPKSGKIKHRVLLLLYWRHFWGIWMMYSCCCIKYTTPRVFIESPFCLCTCLVKHSSTYHYFKQAFYRNGTQLDKAFVSQLPETGSILHIDDGCIDKFILTSASCPL